MRILLFTQVNFFRDRHSDLAWIRSYSQALNESGAEAVFFEPRAHKLDTFDLIHFFSREDSELWYTIKQAGYRVLVTPALPGMTPDSATLLRQVTEGVEQVGRAIVQRRWPPYDEKAMRKCASGYLVVDNQWRDYLLTSWKIDRQKVLVMGSNPAAAARIARQTYQSFIGNPC